MLAVVVEAAARLPPEVPRQHHAAQERRRREARLPVLRLQERGHVEDDVEPDEVGERERAHGVVGAVLHRRVDVGDRAETALEAADRVDHVGDEEAVHDVTGRVGDHDGRLAEPLGEGDAGLHRVRRRLQARRHLDQLHGVHRVEEVEADEALGPAGGGGQLGHGQRRGVGGEDRLRLHDLVEAPEVVPLHRQLLDDRLDDQVDVGEVVQVDRPAQALEQRAVVGGRQPAALDVLVELLLDPGPLRVERPRGGLRHDRVEAGAGRGLRDAEAHLTGAEDADAANLHGAEDPPGRPGYDTSGAGVNQYARRRAGWSSPPRQWYMRRMRDETSLIVPAVRAVLDEALAAGRRTTDGGKAIDEHQVHAERLAYAATEAAAAEALTTYARERAGDEVIGRMAAAFAGEVASRLAAEIEGHRDDFGVRGETLGRTLGAPEVLAAVRAAQHEARLREIGREIIRTRGANNCFIDGEMAEMARDSARSFARKEVAPIAERIHRHDELVPEPIIRRMGELGYFGMSVPEEYGDRAWATW